MNTYKAQKPLQNQLCAQRMQMLKLSIYFDLKGYLQLKNIFYPAKIDYFFS